MIVKNISFTLDNANLVSKEWYGTNWPSVYIIHNRKEAYIGETLNFSSRMKQHLKNNDKRHLDDVIVIAEDTFNKSAILDLESKLIEYVAADASLKLQNSNSGIRNHNYYQKEKYQSAFENIWMELLKREFVKHDLKALENSDLFKFSPYKSLNEDQYDVVHNILLNILELIKNNQNGAFLVSGEAGTGKTVLAMYIMKLLSDGTVMKFLYPETEELESEMDIYQKEALRVNELKFALVVPQVSLRKTLKNVTKNIEGLKASMIIGPSDVVKDDYDLLLVDESHRLKQRIGITNYGSFDNTNRKLGFDHKGTEFDWIMNSSKFQIFFYDAEQSIRPSDVASEKFDNISSDLVMKFCLKSQMRSMGGNDYLLYIKEIFSENPPNVNLKFDNYEFYLFENISDLRKRIKNKNDEEGLARLVAGYAWEWETKNLDYQEIKSSKMYDIKIEEETFVWNSPAKEGWILSENSINEVGSIHTTQGYDLNYVGVIIGEDIFYDPISRKIKVNPDKYKDKKGKVSIKSEDELRDYIINIYITLLSRGIKGTYIYVCDEPLREHMKKYIETF